MPMVRSIRIRRDRSIDLSLGTVVLVPADRVGVRPWVGRFVMRIIVHFQYLPLAGVPASHPVAYCSPRRYQAIP